MYYRLMIRYHAHANSYTDICRCYKAIYEVLCSIQKGCRPYTHCVW